MRTTVSKICPVEQQSPKILLNRKEERKEGSKQGRKGETEGWREER